MTSTAILIPAAGASSRMGGQDKLLQEVAGQPLLRRVIRRALACVPEVYVALPSADHPRTACLSGTTAQAVIVPEAKLGMGHSVATLMAALRHGLKHVMILPADMPDIDQTDLLTMLTAARQDVGTTIYRGASASGVPGHPVLFPACYFDQLAQLSGDQGGRDILRRHADKLRLVILPADHALTDLDTPDDWAAWRKKAR